MSWNTIVDLEKDLPFVFMEGSVLDDFPWEFKAANGEVLGCGNGATILKSFTAHTVTDITRAVIEGKIRLHYTRPAADYVAELKVKPKPAKSFEVNVLFTPDPDVFEDLFRGKVIEARNIKLTFDPEICGCRASKDMVTLRNWNDRSTAASYPNRYTTLHSCLDELEH